MNINIRVVTGVSVTLLALFAGLVLFGYILLNRTLPPQSGELGADMLNNNVNIYTDKNGIVYLDADNEDDLMRALGFVHARERLFQMEAMRRIASGRLSEVAGSKALPIDKLFRTVGLTRIVERDYQNLSEKTKHSLEVYTEGVNLLIEEYGSRFAPELNLFRNDIELWHPEDSYLISKLLGWVLNLSWWTDAAFIDLANKTGAKNINDIIPGFKENLPLKLDKGSFQDVSAAIRMINADKLFREYIGFEGTQLGSNNWVVAPQKSKSGKAIVANDPHLAVTHPNLWYFAVLHSPDLDAAGFTIPGAPGVIIGKNNSLAWGYTNVMADDCDFYFETVDSTGKKYLLDGEWKEFTFVEEKIKVKDSTDVELVIPVNHRGPVINNIRPNSLLFNERPHEKVITMRWTGYEFSDEPGAILNLNRAENVVQFTDAVEGFKVPGQNFLYADSNGNIGYICAARLPVRKDKYPTYIYDGSKSANDWIGFVPYEKMPGIINPRENYVASANNKVVEDFKYHISNIWEPDSRINRIKEFLDRDSLSGVGDFKIMQNDLKSVYAAEIVPKILEIFGNVEVTDKNLGTALELFRQWDYKMDKDSQTPAIFSVFKMKLLYNLFNDEMGETYLKEYSFMTNIPHRIIEEYFAGRKSEWIDNVNTPETETFNDIVRISLVDAVVWLEKNYGTNPADWQWGKLHKLEFTHPFSEASEIVSGIFDIGPFEISGDGTTLSNTEFSFTKPYDVKVIASMRMIYDFAQPDEIHVSLPTGQSGHFMSDFYSNLTNKFVSGDYIVINTNPNNFQNNNYELFVLKRGN